MGQFFQLAQGRHGLRRPYNESQRGILIHRIG